MLGKGSKNKKKIMENLIPYLLKKASKQIFASSDARFCCNTCNDGHNMQNFVCNMRNFSLDMVLSPYFVSGGGSGAWGTPRMTPPITFYCQGRSCLRLGSKKKFWHCLINIKQWQNYFKKTRAEQKNAMLLLMNK